MHVKKPDTLAPQKGHMPTIGRVWPAERVKKSDTNGRLTSSRHGGEAPRLLAHGLAVKAAEAPSADASSRTRPTKAASDKPNARWRTKRQPAWLWVRWERLSPPDVRKAARRASRAGLRPSATSNPFPAGTNERAPDHKKASPAQPGSPDFAEGSEHCPA